MTHDAEYNKAYCWPCGIGYYYEKSFQKTFHAISMSYVGKYGSFINFFIGVIFLAQVITWNRVAGWWQAEEKKPVFVQYGLCVGVKTQMY